MAIEVVPHAERWKPAVEAFNARMRVGGSRWGWYVDPVPGWIPPRPGSGQRTWREMWLAVEDGAIVRGGFALRPQEWRIDGRPAWLADWQGPVSEGAISRTFASLGLRLIREMLALRPLLYSWGHGSDEEPIVRMLRRMGWLMHPTPFALRVLDAPRFLRRNAYLRNTVERRAVLDALALTGLGSVLLGGLARAQRVRGALRGASRGGASGEEVPAFAGWADEVWDRAQGAYRALSVRDGRTLDELVAEGGTPEWSAPARIRVSRAGRPIGWIVIHQRRMRGDARFGDLHVGTLADYFAHPDDAGAVVAAGLEALRSRGVDVVIANQSHPAWLRALEDHGFVLVPHRRLFAGSPALRGELAPIADVQRGLFLTNMDGHGPMGL